MNCVLQIVLVAVLQTPASVVLPANQAAVTLPTVQAVMVTPAGVGSTVLAAMAAPATSAYQFDAAGLGVVVDTTRPRVPYRTDGIALLSDTSQQQLFEYSDGYALRASIHKSTSYAMLPMFLLQYYSGRLLLRERNGGAYAPPWAHRIHGPLAWTMTGVFSVNTVTGVWNFLEARPDPEDRTRRNWHAGLMMAANAGFVVTALLIPGEEPPQPVPIKRAAPHRNVAYVSMGAAVLSYTIMLPFFRKD